MTLLTLQNLSIGRSHDMQFSPVYAGSTVALDTSQSPYKPEMVAKLQARRHGTFEVVPADNQEFRDWLNK